MTSPKTVVLTNKPAMIDNNGRKLIEFEFNIVSDEIVVINGHALANELMKALTTSTAVPRSALPQAPFIGINPNDVLIQSSEPAIDGKRPIRVLIKDTGFNPLRKKRALTDATEAVRNTIELHVNNTQKRLRIA